jgi:hypothetical protein
MRKNKWFVVIAVLLACGFVLVGCDTGNGDSDGGLPSNVKEIRFSASSDNITIKMRSLFEDTHHYVGDCGFTVKVNGEQISVSRSEAIAFEDADFIEIYVEDDNGAYNFKPDDVVLLSYSGNAFPGLPAFTDQKCTYHK